MAEKEKKNASSLKKDDDIEILDEKTRRIAVIKEDDIAPAPKKISKFYFSFRLRVTLLIIGILLLFTTASVMIIWSLRSNVIEQVNYNETSKIHYDVCSKYNDREISDCIPENREYSKDKTIIVRSKFNYQAVFEEAVNYDLSYYVVAVNKIYDPFDPSKVYYEDEETIVDDTLIEGDSSKALLDVSLETDFQKYNTFVENYLNKYSVIADASVDVLLYINDGKDSRSVGRISIPLNEDTFEIHTDTLSKEPRVYSYSLGEWTNANTFYVVLGLFLIIISLLLLTYLTRLVLKITVKKSKYQQKLSAILNDYNHYIVNSDGDYRIDNKKRIIKVATFEELLDARSILNKPIIYSRINNIKSEFVVEDSEIIYRYVLKEADMEE